MHITHIISLASLLVLTACSRPSGPPTIVVSNESGGALTNLAIMGDGLAEHMGTLASGVSTQVIIHPAARSTLTLVFDNPARGTRTIQEFDGTRLADGSVTQVVAVIQSDGKAVISERARKK